MFNNMSTKKIFAGLISLSIAGFLSLSVLAVTPALVGAQNTTGDIDPGAENFGLDSDFSKLGIKSERDVKDTIAQIINIILGFLGIIAVIIILAGGFKWMTAGGNEEKVAESRKMIVQGLIGLIIIFAAWAIASFVIGQLRDIQSI